MAGFGGVDCGRAAAAAPTLEEDPVQFPTRSRSGPGPLRRLLRVLTTAVLAAAGLLTVLASPALASPAGATAAASIGPPGSTITYSQVLARAADWYNRAPSYSQSTYIWDLGQTRKYRTDCSGFVDMALHLKTDPNTSGFADPSRASDFHKQRAIDPGNHGQFNFSTVRTGDFFDDTIDGHMWLFAYWGSDHKHFAYYNFGGGSSGTAPPEIHHGASFSDSTLGFEPINNYVQYRYARITAN